MSGVEAGTAEPVGVYLVDKPAGLSSFAVVRRLRWLLNIRKVGHAGTLDPFASGLLLLCAGRTATRHIETFMAGTKRYLARLQLGVETSTQDPEGQVLSRQAVAVDRAAIRSCLAGMQGEQMQVPPAFSALKHHGRPLYSYARQGIYIEKAARPVRIYRLEMLAYDDRRHELDIAVTCSRGTYIRVLAGDIGTALGCGAHLSALRRTQCGPFGVGEAVDGRLLLGDAGEQGRALLMAARMPVAEAVLRAERHRADSRFQLAGIP